MHEFQLGWRQTACNTYALRADDCSLKHVKSYSFRSGVRAAEKNHSSYIRRKMYSHLQFEPDSIMTNERPSSSFYVSPALVVQVPHPNHAAAGTTHTCVVISGAHRLQREIKNSISCCPCSGNDYLFMHGTVSKV